MLEMKKYLIYNKVNKLYWNNEIGWVDRKSATKFTKEETQKYIYLPLNSIWIGV
jgi:hypothetical protein